MRKSKRHSTHDDWDDWAILNSKCSTCIYWLRGRCYYATDTCGFEDGEDYLNTMYKENEKKKQCCGTCTYHVQENVEDGWVCVNDQSEYLADWTEYNDSCDEWEGRD